MAVDKVSQNFKDFKSPHYPIVEEYIAVNKRDFLQQREQIQIDICCILDGLDDKILDNICQVVVDRFAILEGKTDS